MFLDLNLTHHSNLIQATIRPDHGMRVILLQKGKCHVEHKEKGIYSE